MHQVDPQHSEEKPKSLLYIQYFGNQWKVLEEGNFSALLVAARR